MIDLAEIVEKIDARLKEMGSNATEVSRAATDSKDTIRNWRRAVELDKKSGVDGASATTIKLNQIEKALGIELARNGSGQTPEAQLRAALLAYGVDREDLNRAVSAVKIFLDDDDERPEQGHSLDQSSPSTPHHTKVPSE